MDSSTSTHNNSSVAIQFDNLIYGSAGSFKFTEKLCAAVIPIVVLIEAFVFAVSGCFEFHKVSIKRKNKQPRYGYSELARFSDESRFTVNEIEALYELFNKLSSSIIDDGFIYKEELQLALFRTPHGENLFLDRLPSSFMICARRVSLSEKRFHKSFRLSRW